MLRVALVGNPNSGKTTLFNALTGSSARIGNWPGVTIDKKTGYYHRLGEKIEIVDLPGLYSFNPYTTEEKIARDYILDDQADVIINIVDATNIERNLYLTTQLLEMDVPVVIALNFIDVIEKDGIYIDIVKLANQLRVPIIPISALKNKATRELMANVKAIANTKRMSFSILESSDLGPLISDVKNILSHSLTLHHLDYHAIKLLENDIYEVEMHSEASAHVNELKKQMVFNDANDDFPSKIADCRYKFIENVLKTVIVDRPRPQKLSRTADKIMTHKWFGIPLFALIMFVIFHLTFSEDFLFLSALGLIPQGAFTLPIIGDSAINSPGVMLFSLMELLSESIGTGLTNLTASTPTWIGSLLVDGVWAGVGAVLSFLPQIIVLFIFISILEDSGYMSRVAFMLDRITRKFGLSGRAFLPLLMGFGCTVPAIMATRTLRNEKERRLTILLSPFFSCGAKLPIWLVFGAYLYQGAYSDLVVTSIYLLGIVVALVVGYIANRIFVKSQASPFIMEMPDYRLPKWQNVFTRAWEKVKDYMLRAATLIAASTIIIWFLTSFSFTLTPVTDTRLSMIGSISSFIAPLFIPLGFGQGPDGWVFIVASFTGLIAKEMVPSTLGTIAQISGGDLGSIIGAMTSGSAFAFMAFNLLTIPCIASVSAARAELKSGKKLLVTILLWLGISYVTSSLIYLSVDYLVGTVVIGSLFLFFILYMIIEAVITHKRRKYR